MTNVSPSNFPAESIQENLFVAKQCLLEHEADLVAALDQVRQGLANVKTSLNFIEAEEEEKAARESKSEIATPLLSRRRPSASRSSTMPTSTKPQPQKSSRSSSSAVEDARPAKPAKAKRGRPPKSAAATPDIRKQPPHKPRGRTRMNRQASQAMGWGAYLHDEFKLLSLNEIVQTVLERSPKQSFSIQDILKQIFMKDISEVSLAIVSDRIEAILDLGVEARRWHQTKSGYSMTK